MLHVHSPMFGDDFTILPYPQIYSTDTSSQHVSWILRLVLDFYRFGQKMSSGRLKILTKNPKRRIFRILIF